MSDFSKYLVRPSETAEKVFAAFKEQNPHADMRAIPNEWLLNERALSAKIAEENTALRRQIAAMQEYMNHHYCPFLVNGQHLTHLGNFVHLNPEYNDEN